MFTAANAAGSTGLAVDSEDWWQPTNHRICFVKRQRDQMAWGVKPEKRAIPAWFISVLSELLTAHSQQANGQGKDVQEVWQIVQERSEGEREGRGHVEDSQPEQTMFRLCPSETVRLWASLLVLWDTDSSFAKQSKEPLLAYTTSWLGGPNGMMVVTHTQWEDQWCDLAGFLLVVSKFLYLWFGKWINSTWRLVGPWPSSEHH